MTYYITKYALTAGIYTREGEAEGKHLSLNAGRSDAEFYHNSEFHETKEEAIARAEEMRDRKIASLEKQLDKLRSMDFSRS